MSLPGLDQEASSVAVVQEQSNTITLNPNSEWRYEVSNDEIIKVKLIDGFAEIFGTEISQNIEYTFRGPLKSCIFTYRGCKLQFSGEPSSEYVSEETTMPIYFNLHTLLEEQRKYVTAQNLSRKPNDRLKGPRVLIIGSKDCGRTSLARILVSYAQKMDRQPLLVSLNPQESAFTPPGVLTGTPISEMLNVENINLGETITTGASFYHQKQPIVKYYGSESLEKNEPLYKYEVSRLGVSCLSRLEEDPIVGNSGLVVDTPPLSIKNLNIIENIISDFEINVLVVIGNERLSIDLKKKLTKLNNPPSDPSKKLNLVKVAKSGGCVEKDDSFIRSRQQRVIKEYFYGFDKIVLSPYTITVAYNEVILFQSTNTNEFDQSLIPSADSFIPDSSNADRKGRSTMNFFSRFEPSESSLQHCILTMVNPSQLDLQKYLYTKDDSGLMEDVANSSVLGFAYVIGADDSKERLRILIPQPSKQLPSKVLILTDYRYNE
ncbi:hypothetical protein LJB42_002543 [Komagataella kurtzmanii]|nr:hypothetical protein LJB42_002543 [Komagataella kurtzmanii]